MVAQKEEEAIKSEIETAELLRAYMPVHEQFKDVVLGAWTTSIGIMGVGKSTLIRTLINGINTQFGDYEQLNLHTKDFGRVFGIHSDSEVKERVRQADVINIFVDDTITSMHSRKYNVANEQNWYTVRHYFQDRVGVDAVTLNFFFAAQRYKTLSNALRQSPILIFKAVTIRDWREEQFYRYLLGDKHLRYLKRWVKGIYVDKKFKYLSHSLFKVGDLKPRVWIIPKTPTPEFVELTAQDDEAGALDKRELQLAQLCAYLTRGGIPKHKWRKKNGCMITSQRAIAEALGYKEHRSIGQLLRKLDDYSMVSG